MQQLNSETILLAHNEFKKHSNTGKIVRQGSDIWVSPTNVDHIDIVKLAGFDSPNDHGFIGAHSISGVLRWKIFLSSSILERMGF